MSGTPGHCSHTVSCVEAGKGGRPHDGVRPCVARASSRCFLSSSPCLSLHIPLFRFALRAPTLSCPPALPCRPGVPDTCCKYATETLATYKILIGSLNSGLIGCTYIDQAPNYCAGGGLDYAKVSARVNGHTFVLTRSDPLADAPLRWSPGRRPVWSDVCEQAAVRAV